MLKHLLSPFTPKGKTLRSRNVVAAMGTNSDHAHATCTEIFIPYHEAKAKGGFRIIEDFAVCTDGRSFPFLPGL